MRPVTLSAEEVARMASTLRKAGYQLGRLVIIDRRTSNAHHLASEYVERRVIEALAVLQRAEERATTRSADDE